MKKIFLLSTFIALGSTAALAANSSVEKCVNEIKTQRKANPTEINITDKQAQDYCQCTAPKIDLLNTQTKNSTSIDQKKLAKIIEDCARTSGLLK